MPANHVISVSRVSKRFEIYRKPSDILLEFFSRQPKHTERWALRDVSFELSRGEVVGIVGRNGAGKSTLLKIITGTLRPTTGEVHTQGRIAAIIELGAGFNLERSGRENIILGALCTGLSHDEAKARIEWIIEFSELGAVIDEPMKTYSTGMRARLMFSTAVSFTPDVLIVDEVLSVGDARFQLKSFKHMQDIRAKGTTILFVSHSSAAVSALCTRGIYLDDGRVIEDGLPRDVLKLYHQKLFGEPKRPEPVVAHPNASFDPPVDRSTIASSTLAKTWPEVNGSDDSSGVVSAGGKHGALLGAVTDAVAEEACGGQQIEARAGAGMNSDSGFGPLAGNAVAPASPRASGLNTAEVRVGDRAVELISAHFENSAGAIVHELEIRQEHTLVVTCKLNESVEPPSVGFRITTVHGMDVYGTSTWTLGMQLPTPKTPRSSFQVRFRFLNTLAPGRFFLTAGVAKSPTEVYDRRADILEFEVVGRFHGYSSSLVDLNPSVTVNLG